MDQWGGATIYIYICIYKYNAYIECRYLHMYMFCFNCIAGVF